MEHRLDPLGDLEVRRVLAFARAREQYPSVPRGLLLDYCQAAWQAAGAGGDLHDVLDRFERALMLVAWTHRRSPHLNFRSLVDQVIPQVALKPFMAPADAAPAEEPEAAKLVEIEPAAKRDAVRPPARRFIPRVPFASPVPLGAAVAAGFVGVTIMGQAGALPVAPFAPAGNDGANAPDDGAAPKPHGTASTGAAGGAGAHDGHALVDLARLPGAPDALPPARERTTTPSAGPAHHAAPVHAAAAPPVAEPSAPQPAVVQAPAPVPVVDKTVEEVQAEPAAPEVDGEVPAAGDAGSWAGQHTDVEAP